MAKKIFIWVLVALLVIALCVGAYFYFTQDDKPLDDNKVATETVETASPAEEFLDEDMSGEEYIIDDSEESEESRNDYTPSDDSLSDNTSSITTTKFTISKVVDHTTSQQVQPRVVFGSGFNSNDNYIRFDSNGNFEIYFSGYFNDKTTGVYTAYDDIIYVEYTDGSAAEYDIIRGEDDIIKYIIVNYGDYDVYFA